jgi:hypothetical protein
MNQSVYYNLIVERISRAVSEAAVCAKSIDHSALSGSIREIALRNCIKPYLTHSFKCGTGKVVDTTGHLTKQIDLLVYETKLAPPLMLNEEVGIFPAECCEYAFEVKSTITATEIRSAIEVGKSIRGLKRFPKKQEDGTIHYEKSGLKSVLFAFASDIEGDEMERYLKYDATPPVFTAILVLGKGYWFWDKGWYGISAQELQDPAGLFALFITGFTNTLVTREASMRWFNPGSYILKEDILVRHYQTGAEPA